VRRFKDKEEEGAERRSREKKRFMTNLRKTQGIRQRNEDQRMATEASRQQRQLQGKREAARAAGLDFDDEADPLFGAATVHPNPSTVANC